MSIEDENESEDYFVPLVDQRVFGAGIKRKRVPFVPASTLEANIPNTTTPRPTVGARYLDIVLPPSKRSRSEPPLASSDVANNPERDSILAGSPPAVPSICPTCHAPLLTTTHSTSISHQLSQPHVHPPSHLPRAHVGLRYLTRHGWDPDARVGLGKSGQGISHPIKAVEKRDTVGLHEKKKEESNGREKPIKISQEGQGEGEVKRLNAKEVRRKEAEIRRERERLRQNLFGRVDVEGYLAGVG